MNNNAITNLKDQTPSPNDALSLTNLFKFMGTVFLTATINSLGQFTHDNGQLFVLS